LTIFVEIDGFWSNANFVLRNGSNLEKLGLACRFRPGACRIGELFVFVHDLALPELA